MGKSVKKGEENVIALREYISQGKTEKGERSKFLREGELLYLLSLIHFFIQ